MKTKTETQDWGEFKKSVILTLKSAVAPYSPDFKNYPEFNISEAAEVITKYAEVLLTTRSAEVRKEIGEDIEDLWDRELGRPDAKITLSDIKKVIRVEKL